LRDPLLAFSATLLAVSSFAQSQPARSSPATPHPARTRAASSDTAAQLPVTRVSLYKNGVGFFEHSGRVIGDEAVVIDFTSAQLNDVLQSLTSIDFYNAIRGARVEVRSPAGTLAGRLLSFEVRTTPGPTDNAPSTEKHFVTIASESGDIRTFELTPATTVRLLDTPLRTDLTRYLHLLDGNRNQALRHLTLFDKAPSASRSARDLRVSYLSEVPIWKSTYRILFTDTPSGSTTSPTAAQTATLQGWSVVDNTTGTDWNNVQLSLIAGSPQSFIQPLSQPIYTRRPEIPIAQDAQLTPQTHESATTTANAPQVAGVAGMSGMGAGGGSGMGAELGGVPGGSLEVWERLLAQLPWHNGPLAGQCQRALTSPRPSPTRPPPPTP